VTRVIALTRLLSISWCMVATGAATLRAASALMATAAGCAALLTVAVRSLIEIAIRGLRGTLRALHDLELRCRHHRDSAAQDPFNVAQQAAFIARYQ